jgi:hypothetical protein
MGFGTLQLSEGVVMNTIPTPENLPLLIGRLEESKGEALKALFSGTLDLPHILCTLGNLCKVQVWWSEPVTVYGIARWGKWQLGEDGRKTKTKSTGKKEGPVHVFNGFFLNNDSLCYKFKRDGCHGQYMPHMDKIVKYEPVIDEIKENKFKSYEQFKSKFELFFIGEDLIKQLYSENSSQHGGRYTPSDFHRIGPAGREALRSFMSSFQGVSNANTTTPGYYRRGEPGKEYYCLDGRHTANRHPGRDITIGHTIGLNRVYYSSEFFKCGNGRYGLLANKTEFLWTEDD